MKKKVILWVVFSIILTIFSLFMLFYLDLANGPLALLFIEIVIILLFIAGMILLRKYKIYFKLILILIFIVSNIVIINQAKPIIKSIPAVDYKNPISTEVIELNDGNIRGVYNSDKSVEVYAGIPYAKAPIGELRWKEPKDLEPWSGVLDCSHFQKISYQAYSNEVTSSLVDIYAQKSWHPNYSTKYIQEVSEDSLYLNIWKPANIDTNLPVLVYIHGGSLTSGTSASSDYNGEEMAKTGVIMITIQYRLGVFGYFAHEELINESSNKTTGNYGLLDQIKALEWVNSNIESFGGDKNNITIAGESAGSSSVSALCTSPLAKCLFKRAIGESSSLVVKKAPHTYRTLDSALEMGNNIMAEFNCSNISDLRNVPADKLVKTKYTNSQMTKDGYALTKDPYQVYLDGENNEEALLNGYNVKEADPFVIPTYLFSPTNKNNIKERLNTVFDSNTVDKIMDLYKDKIDNDAFSAFNEIISVYWFIQPHDSWSKMAYNNGVNVYRYQFTKENNYYGTYHSGELIYAYGNVKNSKYSYRYDDTDIKLSNTMLNYWSNFIKYGDPNGSSLEEWEKYDPSKNQVMELGLNVSMITDSYTSLYEIIEEYIDTL